MLFAYYRRAMLDQIGGFDEDLFAYGDDAELGSTRPDRRLEVHLHSGCGGAASSRRDVGAPLVPASGTDRAKSSLLAAKLFPWSLLWLNGVYYAMRLGAGFWAAITGQGEVGKYPGVSGKLRAAMALIKGHWQALGMLPRMLAKRREVEGIRKLRPSEVRKLIMEHRISLKELMRQAVDHDSHLSSQPAARSRKFIPATGNVQNLDSKIDRYFRMLRLPDAKIDVTHLMNKDSLEMTHADRERVLATVREKLAENAAPVIITHGTARWLKPDCCSRRACQNCVIRSC